MLRNLVLGVVLLGLPVNLLAQDRTTDRSVDHRAALDHFDASVIFQMAQSSPELSATRNQILADLLVTGEATDDWATRGVDIRAIAKAFSAERGYAYMVEQSEEGTFVTYRGEPQPLLAKTYIRSRLIEGSGTGEISTTLMSFSPGIWFEFVSGSTFVDNAECSKGVMTVDMLTIKPLSNWSSEEIGLTALLYGIFVELSDADMCVVYEQLGPQTFRSQSFNSDGEPFTAFDEADDISRLMDGEELKQILAASEG